MKASPRATNSAAPADVARLLQEIYPSGPLQLEHGLSGTLQEFLGEHIEFIVRLLGITERPTQNLLKDCLLYTSPSPRD
eukprot:9192788-Alexandrium_andersonii.AAC.1